MAVPHPRIPTGQGQKASPIPLCSLLCLPRHLRARPSPSTQPVRRFSDDSFLPRKRGPSWKSRRTLPLIEQKVINERLNGTNRYEIYAILKPILKHHTPKPSTIYAITRRHGVNRLTTQMQQSKRKIIKTRAGELGYLDSHHAQPGPPGRLQAPLLPSRPHRRLHPYRLGRGRLRHQEPIRQSPSTSSTSSTASNSRLSSPTTAPKWLPPGTSKAIPWNVCSRNCYTRPYRPQTNGKIERVLENPERGPAGGDNLRVGDCPERTAAISALLQYPKTPPGNGRKDPLRDPTIPIILSTNYLTSTIPRPREESCVTRG